MLALSKTGHSIPHINILYFSYYLIHLSLYTGIFWWCLSVYIYIYIYRERERERQIGMRSAFYIQELLLLFIILNYLYHLACHCVSVSKFSNQLALSCLNFWDKLWWFLSFRVFRLLSSSLLLYSQHFAQCILRPSSGVSCWTQEPTQNFEPRPLFNLWGLLAPILLTITRYKC